MRRPNPRFSEVLPKRDPIAVIHEEKDRKRWENRLLVLVVLAFAAYTLPPIQRSAMEAQTDFTFRQSVDREGDLHERGSSPTLGSMAGAVTPATQAWRKTKATFYGNPYDDGKRRICADGKTVYTSDGMFCATRLVPLGTVIEVRYCRWGPWVKHGTGETRSGTYKTLTLKVCDTQAKRFGHLIDLPTLTWDKFGAKRSVGVLAVEWRVKP